MLMNSRTEKVGRGRRFSNGMGVGGGRCDNGGEDGKDGGRGRRGMRRRESLAMSVLGHLNAKPV